MRALLLFCLLAVGFGADINDVLLDKLPLDKNPALSKEQIEKLFSEMQFLNNDKFKLLEAFYRENGDSKNNLQPDYLEALKIYLEVFKENKNPIASLKLGLYAWAFYKDKKPKSSEDAKLSASLKAFFKSIGKTPDYFFLQGFYHNDKTSPHLPTKNLILHNGLLAGIFLVMAQRFDEAIKIFQEPELADLAQAQLWSAFAFLGNNEVQIANLFLDKACKNKNITKGVMAYCASQSVEHTP